jgi:single-strand DNA-binding protein
MANRFIGRGNLGNDPEFKYVDVSGERRALATFNVKIDRWVPTGDNTFEDKGGFWLPTQIWGPRAEPARQLLQKGAGVRVEGRLVLDTWRDGNGIAQQRMVLMADHVDLDLGRLQSVTYKSKDTKTPAESDPSVDTASDGESVERDSVLTESSDVY